jgi:peptide/nickel transport system permease protein
MIRTLRILAANPLSLLGLVLVCLITLAAIFAPLIAPFPTHNGAVVDFANNNRPPSARNWMGTDLVGRDIFSRILFAYQISLTLGVVVLAIAVPIGTMIGLLAGYIGGWLEMEPTLTNAMLAVTAMWWPWYARLVYSIARGEREEGYVLAAEVIGAGAGHIAFREILPNCLPAIITKMTLDMGFVIIIASSLSFLGLGVQPPTADLGSMVAEGARYLPDSWWLTVFPGLAILVAVFGFNLLGDGLRDVLGVDE